MYTTLQGEPVHLKDFCVFQEELNRTGASRRTNLDRLKGQRGGPGSGALLQRLAPLRMNGWPFVQPGFVSGNQAITGCRPLNRRGVPGVTDTPVRRVGGAPNGVFSISIRRILKPQ